MGYVPSVPLFPPHAPTYYKLADAYSRIQKFEDAERLLQRSIWLDATSTGPYILMGKVLEKKGEFDLAVRALQRAVTMDPIIRSLITCWVKPTVTSAAMKRLREN